MPNAVGEAFITIRPNTAGFKAQATPGIVGTAKAMTRAFGGAFAVGAIVKKAFIEPLQAAGDFQRTMQVLQAQSGATNEQMKQVSATAIKLGADVKLPGTSANDAADAMFELAKAGLSVKQAQQAARGVLVASTAAQIDNAQAATIVANALNAFGLQATQATRVSDLLAASANASATDMPQMAQALQQVGASAHALHVPIQDTVTALSLLANAGVQGSDAGTSLKTMFQRLIPSTAAAKNEMQKLGVTAFDAQGNFVGLQNISEQYRVALSKLTPEERAHALQTIFGSDAQRAANIVLGQGYVAFGKMRDRVTEAGAAQKIATAQSKGFAGAMSGLQSTIETLQLKIGLALLPVMTRLVQFMSGALPSAFDAASSFIEGTITRIQELSAAFNNTQIIVIGLAAAFAVFASPTTIILGLAAAAVELYRSFEPVREVVDAVTSAMDSNLQVTAAIAGGLVAGIAAFRTFGIVLAAVGVSAPAAAAGIVEVGTATAVATEEVGAATRAATAFNPLLLALSVGVGLVTTAFLTNTNQTTVMDTAYKNAADAVNGLTDAFADSKSAAEDVTFAQHNLHAAQTQLIAAQQNYRKVVRDSNSTDLERRQALDQVRAAQDNVKRSQRGLTDSTNKANEAHQKATGLLRETRHATVNLTDSYRDAARKLSDLTGKQIDAGQGAQDLAEKLRDYSAKASNAANRTGHLAANMRQAKEDSARAAAAVADLADYLNRLPTHKEIRITETTIRQVSTIEDNRLNRFAGGPVRAGVPYIVGELRPELFVPETNGYIMPSVPPGVRGASRTTSGVGAGGGVSVVFSEGAIVVHAAPGQDPAQIGRAVLDEAFDRAARLGPR